MTHSISCSFALAVVAGLFLAVEIRADDPSQSAAQAEGGGAAGGAAPDGPGKPSGDRVAVTISKETTYLVEPLRKDGYVDYLAAFNSLASEGVTRENNAMVPLIQAVGPKNIDSQIRTRFFELLGIAPLPDEGNYLISLEDHLAELNLDAEEQARIVNEQWESVTEGPWSAEQFPKIAGWVVRNKGPLDRAVLALRRPRFYAPMLTAGEPEMLVAVLLPTLNDMRQVARTLKVRAMLRVKQGDVESAWQDLQACHRLARLVAQSPTLVDVLVAITIDQIACSGDAMLAHYGKLSEDRALTYARAIRELGPLPTMADRIDVAERYMYMDTVCWMAKNGPEALEALDGGSSSATARAISQVVSRTLIDWDVPLKAGNQWYDRMAAAARQPAGEERDRALDAVDQSLQQLARETRDLKSFAGALLTGKSPRTLASEKVSDIFVALLLPAISAAVSAEDRAAADRGMAETALALAAYRAADGRYPPRLDRLVPDHMPKLPQDPFARGPFQYRRTPDGFLLYSVGRNRKDDGGRSQWDDDVDDADDNVVRVPERKKRAE